MRASIPLVMLGFVPRRHFDRRPHHLMSTTLIEFHKSRSGENCLLPGWHIPAKASGAFADCSLILATYKRPDEIINLVKALAQRSDVPAEIVIADGCPEMNLGQRLASWMTEDVAPF